MEEKVFGELLFVFMQLRSTPITRIPLLGSKRCEFLHAYVELRGEMFITMVNLCNGSRVVSLNNLH